jgi:hypothetical protein
MTIKEILEIRNSKDQDGWVAWIESLGTNEAIDVFRKLDEHAKSTSQYKSDKLYGKVVDEISEELNQYEREHREYGSLEEVMNAFITEQGDEYKLMRADTLAKHLKNPKDKKVLELIETFKATEKELGKYDRAFWENPPDFDSLMSEIKKLMRKLGY